MKSFAKLSFLKQSPRKRSALLIAGMAGVVLVAVLINLGLTRFILKGYFSESGFAVPQSSLTGFLTNEDAEGVVLLVPVDMGEAYYAQSSNSNTYYVGEEKTGISSGYPLYARGGQVLCFVDDKLKLVTADWNTLDTYDGLYESDGITFNADNSQADIEEVILVRVDGGYAVAEETVVEVVKNAPVVIPMNSVCSFRESEVVYYSLVENRMFGNRMEVPSGAVITIGGNSYTYLDFLKNLGIWEEKNEQLTEPEIEPTPEQEDIPEQEEEQEEKNEPVSGGEGTTALGTVDDLTEMTETVPGEEGEPEPAGNKPNENQQAGESTGKAEHSGRTSSKEVSTEFEAAAAALSNPNEKPAEAAPAEKPAERNVDYVKPTVTFSGGLTPWVYTIRTTVTVEDPAGRLDGGVRILVYNVADDGTETQALRRVITASGTVDLGQLTPKKTFHIKAEYTYYDKLNYKQSESLDLGTATTLPFSEIGQIKLRLRDETENAQQATDESKVQIFSTCLQMKDMVFSNVSNGLVTELGTTGNSTAVNATKAESYVNSMDMSITGDVNYSIKVDAAAVQLLRAGYTLSHWETSETLASSKTYHYTFSMIDRYGNKFDVVYVDGKGMTLSNEHQYQGHTCKETPFVTISIPARLNVEGSTQFEITWNNPDAATVEADVRTGVDSYPYTDEPVSLYLVEKGKELDPANAVPLNATRPSDSTVVTGQKFLPVLGGSTNASGVTIWVVTNLTPVQEYTAVVLCGHYDIDDGQYHYSENLESTAGFITASLANLGSIPYRYSVDNLKFDSARLNLRIQSNPNGRYFDLRLLNFVSYAELELSVDGGDTLGTARLTKEGLSAISLTGAVSVDAATGLFRRDVQIPVYWNGEEVPHTVTAGLLYKDTLPTRTFTTGNAAVDNVWDFLMATNEQTDDCYMALPLGGSMPLLEGETEAVRLMALEGQTAYKGRLHFYAVQGGGAAQDVTSGSSPDISFRTVSRDAVAVFSNAFVTSNFIELIDLSISDLDDCILPDDADRGGNNVLVEVLNSNGVRVASKYMDSSQAYSSFRIGGLENETDYVLRFHPLKYVNGGQTELDHYLTIRLVEQSGAEDPTRYPFKTGDSISGDLELNRVQQLYESSGGGFTTQLSILSDDDFYDGVFLDSSRMFYTYVPDEELGSLGDDQKAILINGINNDSPTVPPTSGTTRDELIAQIRQKERDFIANNDNDAMTQILGATQSSTLSIRHVSFYSTDKSLQQNIADYGWATRFIRVNPGEQYVLYNSNDISYFRIVYYYRNSSTGNLQYYTPQWNSAAYYYGDVFEVPSRGTANNTTDILYMRISGYTTRGRDAMVLEKYDPSRTEGRDNLVLDEAAFNAATTDEARAAAFNISMGVYLNSTNGISLSTAYAYTPEYIPVTGGSVYELKGRNANKPDASAKQNANMTYASNSVLFYDASHNFVGSYTVGEQTALVKAPFGAAYCRFNVTCNNAVSPATFRFWDDNGNVLLSMKLYQEAVSDRFIASVHVDLDDASSPSLLRGGSYIVTLYQTVETVSDADDLSALGSRSWDMHSERSELLTDSVRVNKDISFPDLAANHGFKAVLRVNPNGWWDDDGSPTYIELDTIYFTTNRVARAIATYADLLSVWSDPAGSYIVVKDIEGVNAQVLNSTRPFTGTIDFQGHTIKVNKNSFEPLFYQVSSTGVVKNINLVYEPDNTSLTSVNYYRAALVAYNYGTLQNVVVHYGPTFKEANAVPFLYSGIISAYNYGTIDGFVIELTKDVRVRYYFGGASWQNDGYVGNGYVTGKYLQDGHQASIIHMNPEEYLNGTTVATSSTDAVAYGVAYNRMGGVVENVFVVQDQLVLQSANMELDNDRYYFTNADQEDNSTTNTHTAGLLTGSNQGTVRNGFTVGDRVDVSADVPVAQAASTAVKRYMTYRGPAVPYTAGLFDVSNITYFSDRVYANSTSTLSTYIYDGAPYTGEYTKDRVRSAAVNIGDYNLRGDWSSLYDYKWYEGVLGADGGRFDIRANVEENMYPKLILPDCFPSSAQPDVYLPGAAPETIIVTDNVVRAESIDNQALVTVTLVSPTEIKVTGMDIVDQFSSSGTLTCQVLDQRTLEDTLRVDILIGLNDTVRAGNQYTIRTVYVNGQPYAASSLSDERVIAVDFWKDISNEAEYRSAICNTDTNAFNCRLTADLDFSGESFNGHLWHRSEGFYGKLDGGIYDTEKTVITNDRGETVLFKNTGEVATDGVGVPRSLTTRGSLIGMHKISGVGNVDVEGNVDNARNASYEYYNSLFRSLYGTLENIVFEEFVTKDNSDTMIRNNHPSYYQIPANVYYGGVVAEMSRSAVIENCHVRDSAFSARCMSGSLVGRVNGGTIRNCSVRNTTVTSYRVSGGTDTVYVGGLIGYASNCAIDNCFAADVTVTAPDVYFSSGVGGLIGQISSAAVRNCYTTGTVDAACNYVGGIAGDITSETSELSGCWSNATVITTGDFAGSIAGRYQSGMMTNNYAVGTVITRSLASNYVHRIASNTTFSEVYRHDNYAFSGQYLTYTQFGLKDTNGNPLSPYQFGIWGELDGAARLISAEEAGSAGIWLNEIGVDGESFDLGGVGTVRSGALSGGVPASGNTRRTSLAGGYMPKLTDPDTGVLLYDQPDALIGFNSNSLLTDIRTAQGQGESINVDIVLFSQRDQDSFLLPRPDNSNGYLHVADWENISVIGGYIKGSDVKINTVTKDNNGQYSGAYQDLEVYPDKAHAYGLVLNFTLYYGDTATTQAESAGKNVLGRYLDSYIVTLPVYIDETRSVTENIQVRISIAGNPVYYDIKSIDDWNNFFVPGGNHASAYENVRLNPSNGTLNLSVNDSSGNSAYTAVQANRVIGAGTTEPSYTKITFSRQNAGTARTLFSQVASEVSYLDFNNVTLDSLDNGTSYKGVIGVLTGSIRHVEFNNVTVKTTGSPSYMGLIGMLYTDAEDITLNNVQILSGSSYYIGGLVGQADTAATISKVTANDVTVQSNGAYIGGITGILYGVGHDITVTNTKVYGRCYVGGVAGQASGDAGRPDVLKLENVFVGCTPGTDGVTPVYTDATMDPGCLVDDSDDLAPSVTVSAINLNASETPTSNTSDVYYIGGAVGYAASRPMSNVRVFNTLTEVPNERCDSNGDVIQSQRVYCGGVCGYDGGGIRDSESRNCTVRSTGLYVGGFCGSGVGVRNVSVNNAVYGLGAASAYVGGMSGVNGGNRDVVQHCVVSGWDNVGGCSGNPASNYYESSILDTLVIGRDNVGGFGGIQTYYYTQYVTVASSLDENGEANVSITLRANGNQLSDYTGARAQEGHSFSGTQILGENNVGGLYGSFTGGVRIIYSTVGTGVKVTGTGNCVGGLVGVFEGWKRGSWETTQRSLYQCACGADVTGGNYVGGLIGEYTYHFENDEVYNYMMNLENAPSTASGMRTARRPIGGNFYGLLFTGNVTNTSDNKTYSSFLIGRLYDPKNDSVDAPVLDDHNGKALGDVYTVVTVNNEPYNSRTGYGTYFNVCRVYAGSQLNGVAANAVDRNSDESPDYPVYQNFKATGTAYTRGGTSGTQAEAPFRQLMTVSAADLADPITYFGARDGWSCGMGWSRSVWSDASLAQLYTVDTGHAPADFDTYKSGIKQDGLVLWLDARNNTGNGYMDADATTWKDLSGQNNNATLYWNNKTVDGEVAIEVSEYNAYMRWANGGLEFINSGSYYAQLANSISDYLNAKDGNGNKHFTVELIYTMIDPLSQGHYGILSWRSGNIYGGFHGSYGKTQNYNTSYYPYAFVHYMSASGGSTSWNMNTSSSMKTGTTTINTSSDGYRYLGEQLSRTATFVVNTDTANNGYKDLSGYNNTWSLYYINGVAVGYNNSKLTQNNSNDLTQYDFPGANESTTWRVGPGAYGTSGVRVCGIRVYDCALTENEIVQNARYDDWYYYGGAKPDGATAKTGSDGMWTDNAAYSLFRSTDKSYNGMLIDSAYAGDGTGFSRGYYYLRGGAAGNYAYSTVKTVNERNYLPQLWHTGFATADYYAVNRERYQYAQEGEKTSGELLSVEDRFYEGGYRLPNSDATARNQYSTAQVVGMFISPRRAMAVQMVALPEATAYASGVDRVNLELLSDPPEGLSYRVLVGEEEKLAGDWPQDSRTLTMTWDYNAPFTLELSLNGTTSETAFSYAELARSVMTYGSGYWYLYGSECYDAAGSSVNTEVEFIHMADGALLGADGGVYGTDGVRIRAVTPYQIVETTPVWSGALLLDGDAVTVESFGTYLVSGGNIQSTQLVVKGDVAYTMPASGVRVGSFVADSYGESLYSTVLGTDGILVDQGTELCYPQDFGNANVREISNTLGYSGQIVLVRYNSGKLVGFNYITGEEEKTLISDETQAQSLTEFIGEALSNLLGGGRSLLSGGASQSLNALAYQNEVSGNASLRTALANLKSNEKNTSITDGEGSGVYGETAGGLDGEPTAAGLDADNGVESLAIDGQTATEGTAVEGGTIAEAGGAAIDGAAAESAPEAPDSEVSQTEDRTADKSESEELRDAAGETPETGEETPETGGEYAETDRDGSEETEAPEGESGTTAFAAGEASGAEDPSEPGADSIEEAGRASAASLQATAVWTQYVSVYDAETGTSAVYDLKELLTQPEEELVTQNERAEQLEEMGFHTTLSTRVTPAEEQASGIRLMILLSVGVAILLGAMATIRRRRFDEEEK